MMRRKSSRRLTEKREGRGVGGGRVKMGVFRVVFEAVVLFFVRRVETVT